MLTVREAGRQLNVSPSLVYALCSRGLIDHHRCGLGRGTIRIRPEALQAYLERSKAIVRSHPRKGDGSFATLDSARLAAAWKRQRAL